MSAKKSTMSGESSPTTPESTSESPSKLTVEQAEAPSGDSSGESLVSLNDIVQESQAALSEPPPPIKNKGGRPKGSKTLKRHGKYATQAAETPSTPLSQEPTGPQITLAPILGVAIGIPYDLAAKRTGFDGFRLNAEERDGLGQAMDAVLLKYFPQVSDKFGVELMLCSTVLAVTMSKFVEFQAFQEKKFEEAKRIENEKVRTMNPTHGVTPQPMTGQVKTDPHAHAIFS